VWCDCLWCVCDWRNHNRPGTTTALALRTRQCCDPSTMPPPTRALGMYVGARKSHKQCMCSGHPGGPHLPDCETMTASVCHYTRLFAWVVVNAMRVRAFVPLHIYATVQNPHGWVNSWFGVYCSLPVCVNTSPVWHNIDVRKAFGIYMGVAHRACHYSSNGYYHHGMPT